ncbi:MAG: apolipoprotein N-acyltransferase [Thermoguttaceae bacterium]|nr:apolipoprotein N-acyltransferase [Thermoguttaceae bacterium]
MFLTSRFFTVLLVLHVLCYALALPLVGWKWLIFPALAAVALPVLPRRLPGKHPYRKLWFAGFCFWFYVTHFVRFPHWINYGLWVALGAYLGVYLPLFTACARRLYHWRLPRLFYPVLGRRVFSPVFRTLAFLFSVTISWAACDVLRGWVLSGFMMGSAADVFWRDPIWLQTADLFGQWGVSSFLAFLSACMVLIVSGLAWKFNHKMSVDLVKTPLVCLIFGLIFLLGYGDWRLHQPNPNDPCGTIALLQGDVPAALKITPELIEKTDTTYSKLVQKVRMRGNVDLVVYPEFIYRDPVVFAEPNAYQPPEILDEAGNPVDPAVYQSWLEEASRQSQQDLLNFAHYGIGTQFLAGCTTFYFGKDRQEIYNSAILVGPQTEKLNLSSEYHKMILVPFGEYVPLVPTLRKWFPKIEEFLPIASQDAGNKPVCVTFQTKEGCEMRASLNICYESALSRLTRRQIAGLRKEGMEPDCIINLTNNGWFGYSHETRMHEACGVLRAIENRKPFLTAANWGITASINSNGRILDEVPAGKSQVLYTSVQPDPRRTVFTAWGGVLLWIPLAVMAFAFSPSVSFRSFRAKS